MNLSNRVSSDDMQRVNDIRNHPQFEPGFEGGGDDIMGGDDSFNLDDLFGESSGSDSGFGGGDTGFGSSGSSGGSLDDIFGSSDSFGGNNGGFGSNNGGFGNNSGFGNNNGFGSGFGANNGFGGNTGFGGINSPFGQNTQGQMQQPTPDRMDKAIDASLDTAKTLGEILVELVKSIRLRNVDDIAYMSRNSILCGGGLLIGGLLLGIIGKIAGISMLSFSGIGAQLLLCGGLMLASGTIGMGTSALVLEKFGRSNAGSIDDIEDVPSGDDNFSQEYSDSIGDELDDLFGDEFDNLLSDEDEDDSSETFSLDDTDTSDDNDTINYDDMEDDGAPVDFSSKFDEIAENQVLNRQTLFNTFKPLFPTNTPNFAKVKEIDKTSNDFNVLETICLKALSNIANCQLEELDSSLESANESFFSYELRLKRINKVKKTEDLAREIEAYMRESSDDDGVNASVTIEGDFYKIIVTKGESAVVTFGDVFRQNYCCDFFLNNKNKLPMISGIDELGNVIVEDAKNFDTMLIAGKPRSGKSWYVLSILMSLMLFNSPEDVQFCIIDPKESNLFKTMALMPHVCGLHNDEHILDILSDIIEVEAPRRKRLLADNRCDDIWALKKKGIKLPVLYVVIDEYITVLNNLDKEGQKEFDAKIQTLISQLPSQGIRLIFVPHRATGIVNKTNRTMLQFTAAVRADTADVIDTLGIQKWSRALTKPGDIAIKSATMKTAKYVRGAALTTDDGDNTIFMENAAKAFYKMGVEMPDMSNMRIAVNRDETYIKNELGGNNVIQFNADEFENSINADTIDF